MKTLKLFSLLEVTPTKEYRTTTLFRAHTKDERGMMSFSSFNRLNNNRLSNLSFVVAKSLVLSLLSLSDKLLSSSSLINFFF